MSFEDRPSSLKGNVGERIVDEWLARKGQVPYRPDHGAPHPFDRLVASRDKRGLCIVEVKTKPRRNAYRDTGIDLRHYDDYQHVTTRYRVPLFLAFVDEEEGLIYGNWWSELLKPAEPDLSSRAGGCEQYPWKHKGKIYFHLTVMKPIAQLSPEQREELRRLRKSNWVDRAEREAV